MKHICQRFRLVSFLLLFGGMFLSAQSYADYTQSTVPYDFIDISSTGEVLLEGCDECAGAINIGFPFTYYGRVYTHVYVSANGFVIPGPSAPLLDNRIGCCSGVGLPFEDNIDGMMALWWNDLSMKADPLSEAVEENGSVFTELTGSSGSYIFVIQFNNVRHFHNLSTNTANTFQLKLFQADNHIEFHYKELVITPNQHSIGIESPQEDDGIEYFLGNDLASLPNNGKQFAISFAPESDTKFTSSLRYAVEESSLNHVFEIDDSSITDINDLDIDAFLEASSITETINTESATLLQTNPARISIPYSTFNTLNETAGSTFADAVDFRVDGGEFLMMESQTIFIEQTAIITANALVSSVTVSRNQELEAFISAADLVSTNNKVKVANARDIYLQAFTDFITGASVIFQLTEFGSSIDCGIPHIDDGDDYTYLYVICETGDSANQVVLKRFDIETFVDDDVDDTVLDIATTLHTFGGQITSQALVTAYNNNYAYTKDDGAGNQDVYLTLGSAAEFQVNSATGTIKSLVMDDSGTKLAYVLDNTLYYYDADSAIETLVTSDGVSSVDISGDGTTLVFSSTSNATGTNSDLSLEVFTVPTSTPNSASFIQMTELAAGECKHPVISDQANRIALVCNADLLAASNDFTNRQAVFVIETITGSAVTHLITNVSDKSQNIARLSMSGNGATLMFEDGDENRAYRLSGLNSFSASTEFGTSESLAGAKDFPVPFVLPGDGTSGTLFFGMCLLLLMTFILRRVTFF